MFCLSPVFVILDFSLSELVCISTKISWFHPKSFPFLVGDFIEKKKSVIGYLSYLILALRVHFTDIFYPDVPISLDVFFISYRPAPLAATSGFYESLDQVMDSTHHCRQYSFSPHTVKDTLHATKSYLAEFFLRCMAAVFGIWSTSLNVCYLAVCANVSSLKEFFCRKTLVEITSCRETLKKLFKIKEGCIHKCPQWNYVWNININ